MQYYPPGPQGPLTCGKIAVNAKQHTGHFTGMNTLSEHTAVAHTANWLHLDTFPLMGYALVSFTTEHKTTLTPGKQCFTMNASKYSGHLC